MRSCSYSLTKNRAAKVGSWDMSAAKQQRVLQGQLALAELQGGLCAPTRLSRAQTV